MIKKLLIANRGEIAIRIARAAAEMGIASVGVFSEDDAAALHVRKVDEAVPLAGAGPRAYLDAAQLIAIAAARGCDAIHPGYGFLSERADFARACQSAGVRFVGPAPETLELFGDKAAARALALRCGLPVLPGTEGATTLEEAQAFVAACGPDAAVMVKAVHGGGGRGMRLVHNAADLPEAFERCASEARAAFGDGALYVERYLPRVRHVEVQIAGDGTTVIHLWDRECSLQRQRQKLIEIAPALVVSNAVREQLFEAAVALGKAANYRGLGTIEFLVPMDEGAEPVFVFMEANARLQVEHPVTEAVTGLDLVRLQLDLAQGRSLKELKLSQASVPKPRGVALEARINLETMREDGSAAPGSGAITAFETPSGPGVRVDTHGYAGYQPSARFDSLLAKVIVHAADGGLRAAASKARWALSEFNIAGVPTNAAFLQAVLAEPEVLDGQSHTLLIEEAISRLLAPPAAERKRYFEGAAKTPTQPARRDADPLAVLRYAASAREDAAVEQERVQDGAAVRAPLQGTLVQVSVAIGDTVRAGQTLFVLEAMKMEHVVTAETAGIVREIVAGIENTVAAGAALAYLERIALDDAAEIARADIDLDHIRPDLAEVLARQARKLDAARPEAVARRRKTKQRTTRENIDDMCDADTFTEYGGLVIAARSKRNTQEELIAQTPADGMIMGLGAINGAAFPPEKARAALIAYDYTVLAGTQGKRNHLKLDRMAELISRWQLPTVLFAEGGGGRPGDTEGGGFIRGFELWARLSGAVPLIGIVSGRCFAGNAAMLGCCDVIIATEDATLGMAGPAMIEGGGLGVFRPEEIGPLRVMQENGVIDVTVADEAAAVAAGKKYLAFFQGPTKDWACADQRLLRSAIPENRLRVYDLRALISTLFDTDSVLELRPHFGRAAIVGFARVEGIPVGYIANNPAHLGGAIDSDAADKIARFMQLCEAFDIPIVSLSDTPGNMVGPEAEKAALIRHCARPFLIGANLTVPLFSIILRKSYGLGAIAMIGGSELATMFCVSWPTGEFGGMGLEGYVKLGFRKELEAIKDPAERKAKFDEMVAHQYARNKALARGTSPTLDDVIDPADTRRWILAGLRALPPKPPRTGKKLPWIDAW